MLSFDVDIAIFGGGIGGLWLLNRLLAQGYGAVLLENGELGGGQSVNSQGMIHGGIKYALGGALTGASEAIADMPERWRACLRGGGDVDLRAAEVLSEHFYLWSTENLTSRLTAFFGSRMTRGRVDSVPAAQRPPIFRDPAFRGSLYKLVDMVLDVPTVVQALADNARGRIFRSDRGVQFSRDANGDITSISFDSGGEAVTLRPQSVVFSAGEGNEALLAAVGCSSPAMQRRPLHQALVEHDYPHPLYAHCTGGNPSPRLTISSHRGRDGRWVWYLGGDLATSGVELDEGALIDKGRRELAELFPWVDFGRTRWATLRIDRAEPRQRGLVKPDKAFAAVANGCANLIVAWPTKLTLAPNMADEVDAILNCEPLNRPLPDAAAALPAPTVARPCWERLL